MTILDRTRLTDLLHIFYNIRKQIGKPICFALLLNIIINVKFSYKDKEFYIYTSYILYNFLQEKSN